MGQEEEMVDTGSWGTGNTNQTPPRSWDWANLPLRTTSRIRQQDLAIILGGWDTRGTWEEEGPTGRSS